MRRPRKHRRHPDIWRERHMAENRAARADLRAPWSPFADDFWLSINAACLEPATATLTLEDMQAVYDRVMGDTIAI